MYLGKPHTIERDGDGATGYSNMIFIVNPQTHEILDYITLDNVIEDNHKLNLETYLQTYDAIVLGGGRYDKYLEKRNRVIIPDEDGTLQEFVLFEVDKYRDTEGRKTHFYAHASYLELKKANIIYPNKYESLTASQLGGIALNDTGWQIGIVEASGTRTMTIENHTSPYEFIKRIAREFEVELRFRVETDGQRITGRYVDMLERIGEWRGRQVEFGRDLDGIRRIEKQDIVTALLGLGPEKEDGTRMEVLVEDEDALQRWGRVDEHGNLHHLIEPYEIQSDRQEMTEEEARQYTRTALDKRINTQVGYETTVVDLEEVPGMSNKKIRFCDTIRIKDVHFNPPLYLEARVYEMTRSLKHKAKKDIKLGDYIEYTEEEVSAVFNQLRNEIRRKASMAQVREYAEPTIIESPTPPQIEAGENSEWMHTSGKIKLGDYIEYTDEEVSAVYNQLRNEIRRKVSMAQVREYAEPKIIESPTPPPIESGENAKWIDTSGEIKVPHVVIGDEWVKMSPTEHDISDADRLSSGIIDVGQVPLRTSVSGARIEWDGVNGLVQYDANDNVVTHLSLDGDATFSGHLQGAKGTFASEGTFEGEGTTTTIDRVLTVENQYFQSSLRPENLFFSYKGDERGATTVSAGGLHVYEGLKTISGISLSDSGWLSIFSYEGYEWIDIVAYDIDLNGHVDVSGSLKLENASGTSNALEFPSGHMISESSNNGYLYIYGNRATGRVFTIRSHNNKSSYRDDFQLNNSGEIISIPTRDNPVTWAGRAAVGATTGRFGFVSSSKRYKLAIEDVKSDPYNILKLSPKSWYDKKNTEEIAELLTRQYNGEKVSFDEVEHLERIPGLIAEEVEEAGLGEFVTYDDKGNVDGVQYERLWTLLLPIVRDLKERIDEIESKCKCGR